METHLFSVLAHIFVYLACPPIHKLRFCSFCYVRSRLDGFRAASIMLSAGAPHRSCSVVGYTDQHTWVQEASEDTTVKWTHYFEGNASATVGKNLLICIRANRLEPDCFANLSRYNTGPAMKLFQKDQCQLSVTNCRRQKCKYWCII